MQKTYDAILKGDTVQWQNGRPDSAKPVPVRITLLNEGSSTSNGPAMANALAEIASRNELSIEADPVEWQREMRKDRSISAREE